MEGNRIDLTINSGLARDVIVGFLREETEKFGFRRLVLGLSGGVDSALVALLAREAMGKDNLFLFYLPYKSSDPKSREDAFLVADFLGLPLKEIDITPMIDAYFQVEKDADQVRRGNKMARERMAILFDQAMALSAMVVGASNKTELLLGYSTWYGDMACSLMPIGDLYKTQVWQMAKDFGLPSRIVEKVPSADLWPGQTDEGELGFKYLQADQILFLLVDERKAPEEVEAAGFSRELIERIIERVRRYQFKRKMPPICKLSSRTIGWDFNYLRDWGK
ncbi:MAG: NAD+ synthase [Caldiserica bacterium]|jgi:NAD+ synthase|nr:NAD+ synthase [Caldisericota bacterium]MDH7562683.1 NAD+ synthase [Caldisericota bacterium]